MTSLGALKLASRDARTYFFLAAIFALLLALSEIFEFVELPFEPLVGHLLTSGSVFSVGLVTSSMVRYGYGGLFILMFLESASLPIPSEVVLPFAGYLVFMGNLNFVGVVLITTAAGLLGALVDYYLALKLGRPVVQRLFKWSGVRPEHLDRAERWLDEKGSWSILIARFIPGIRSAISFPAGALEMRLSGFVTMTTIGALGWSVLLTYLGYSAGTLWQTAFARSASIVVEAVLFCVALASACYIVYFLFVKVVRGH